MWEIIILLLSAWLGGFIILAYRARLRKKSKSSQIACEQMQRETRDFLAHLDALHQVRKQLWAEHQDDSQTTED